MKELENHKFDPDIRVEKQVQQEVKLKKVGHLKPHKGHTVFKFNTKTHEITKAQFEPHMPEAFGKQNKRIVVEEDCIYVSALNLKNAARKIAKYHGINFKIK